MHVGFYRVEYISGLTKSLPFAHSGARHRIITRLLLLAFKGVTKAAMSDFQNMTLQQGVTHSHFLLVARQSGLTLPCSFFNINATMNNSKLPLLPSILHLHLPHSKSACKTTYVKQLRGYISALFHRSPRYDKMHVIDPKAPLANYRELTTGLLHPQSSILIQLCTGHIQLNHHHCNIGAAPTLMCPACDVKEETV